MGFEYLGWWSWVTKGLYHLNGNSTDSSGNGYNLTNNWTTPYSAGKFWQAIDFGTGNNSKYLSNASFPNLCWYNTWLTISFRINFNSTTFAALETIFSSTDTSWNGVYFRIVNSTTTHFRFGNGINSDWWTTSITKSWTAWVWYNVVMTHSATANNYYINWHLVWTRTTNVTLSWWGNGINIGRSIGWSSYANCKIDEFIVDAAERSAAKVKKAYTYAKWRFGII